VLVVASWSIDRLEKEMRREFGGEREREREATLQRGLARLFLVEGTCADHA